MSTQQGDHDDAGETVRMSDLLKALAILIKMDFEGPPLTLLIERLDLEILKRLKSEGRDSLGARKAQRRFLSTVDAARFLGISAETLIRLRTSRYGPRYSRLSVRVARYCYRPEELNAWLDEYLHDPKQWPDISSKADLL